MSVGYDEFYSIQILYLLINTATTVFGLFLELPFVVGPIVLMVTLYFYETILETYVKHQLIGFLRSSYYSSRDSWADNLPQVRTKMGTRPTDLAEYQSIVGLATLKLEEDYIPENMLKGLPVGYVVRVGLNYLGIPLVYNLSRARYLEETSVVRATVTREDSSTSMIFTLGFLLKIPFYFLSRSSLDEPTVNSYSFFYRPFKPPRLPFQETGLSAQRRELNPDIIHLYGAGLKTRTDYVLLLREVANYVLTPLNKLLDFFQDCQFDVLYDYRKRRIVAISLPLSFKDLK